MPPDPDWTLYRTLAALLAEGSLSGASPQASSNPATLGPATSDRRHRERSEERAISEI